MAFEKSVSTTYAELDESTKYRFAEIELGKALGPLTTLHLFATMPRQAGQNLLASALMSNVSPPKERAFNDLLNSHSLIYPSKQEVIHYLLVQGHSYSKIRDVTSASFNTISKFKFGTPQYFPTFPYWDQELLQKWNHLKKTLNIFNEELLHMKNS